MRRVLLIGVCLLLGLLTIAGCGQGGDIKVQGAAPISRDEVDYWVKYQLISRNFTSDKLVALQAPLDPPKFTRCQKFVRKMTPSFSANATQKEFLSTCRNYYNDLYQSVVNTLIVSRWASSPNNSLRGTVPKKVPMIMSQLEVASTFPSRPDKDYFFRTTGLSYSILAKRRKMDVAALQYAERSKENVTPPSRAEVASYINNNPRQFRRVPRQARLARAERILTQKKIAERSGIYDIDQVRKVTTCPDWLDSPLCGNRPAPVGRNKRVTNLAGPLVPPSADVDIRGQAYNVAGEAQGISEDILGQNDLIEGSPLPLVERADVAGVEVVIKDDTQDQVARKNRK